MRTETDLPITPKRALHRRFFPVVGARVTGLPGEKRDCGLYPDEPEACRRRLLPFLRVMLQLGILLVIFKTYRIEGRAFLALARLALIALPVHYLAPYRFKKYVFVTASIAGLFWVFDSEGAAIVLGLSAVLIGICFLPISWKARAFGLVVLASILAYVRSHATVPLVPGTVWPVLATMFMFRMMIYMYELKHARAPESLIDTISYFFLLPNYCFMHFPVVDYRTLQRGYFADDVHAIQRRGLQMMYRGTLHLLCYRLIYHELLIPAGEVHDLASLAGYLVCNYLLYLRVSGQFHMACGMLHLFGYQLPETHHLYLLATGFTDYWRRINIYWKDFMVRLFFNPVVFRLKRWPRPAALAVATLTVFLATWALHAYQSFWLRGSWSFSAPDGLFWGILGVLVLVNVQLDARRGLTKNAASGRLRPPESAAGTIALGPFCLRAFKIAATFTTIVLLWSLWSSASLNVWLDMMQRGLLGA
jgi:alginate O-acetyltransferase complex protein AlgI